MLIDKYNYKVDKIIVSSYRSNHNKKNLLSILWNSNEEGDQFLNLYGYVEENSDRLRKKYLRFISDFNNSEINSIKLYDHFKLKNGYNLLWMSLISEKSPFKSPKILDCLKLLALEEIILSAGPSSIDYFGSNYNEHRSIKNLSTSLGLRYRWKYHLPQMKVSRATIIKSILFACPYLFQAFISMVRYIYMRMPFFRNMNIKWNDHNKSVFFFSYFVALDDEKLKDNIFYSHQWGPLKKIFHEMAIDTNWMHHYISSSQNLTPNIAKKNINIFNQNPEINGCHNFIDSYFSFKIILEVINEYLHIYIKQLRFSIVNKIFTPRKSKANFWFFLKHDWYSSIRGVVAIQNLLMIKLIDKAFKDLPKQKIGFYLMENQGWEMALINGWKVNNHGTLIGVAHSTVRYWDLRYYDLEETSKKNTKPKPDFFTVNGLAAQKNLKASKSRIDNLRNVEALRYLYLNDQIQAIHNKRSEQHNKILVLGDIQKDLTRSMIDCFNDIADQFDHYDFIFKPHPANIIEDKNFSSFKPTTTDEHLNVLLQNIDCVIASAATSSGLEAYILGIPVITYFDSKEFNISALRGMHNAVFVNNPKSLAKAIMNLKSTEGGEEGQDVFWLDDALPRWRKLLSEFEYNLLDDKG